MDAVTDDYDRWPLLWIRVTEAPSASVAEAVRAALDRGLERAERHAAVIVLQAVGMPPGRLIRRQAKWFAARREQLTAHCRGIAIVTSSPAMRGIPHALGFILPLPTPMRAWKTEDEARAWCEARLRPD